MKAILFSGAATFLTGVAWANEAFTFVALPDTQNYIASSATSLLFGQQTQWIADQIQVAGNPRNIQFVSHLGDVVSDGANTSEWQWADEAMDILDGVVKYSILPGNHDYESSSVKSSGTTSFVDTFGPQRFVNADWYGGADPSGNNSFQRFSAGGYDFIHLAVEWEPTLNLPHREISPIDWAQSVIDANPNIPVILSTHEYIQDNPGGRSIAGDALWDELIRKNDQIFLVLNGHFHGFGPPYGGEYHQVSLNDADRPVVEVLQNFQHYPNGGDGWLRLVNFNIANDQLVFETYSPALNEFQTDEVDDSGPYASQFSFDIDFANRLVPMIIAPPLVPGDFDVDGDVDGRDFLVWQRGESPSPWSQADLAEWQSHYGTAETIAAISLTVPEPTSAMLCMLAFTWTSCIRMSSNSVH